MPARASSARESDCKDIAKKVKISSLRHFFFFKKQISFIFAIKLRKLTQEISYEKDFCIVPIGCRGGCGRLR